jgi:hypothetical protein
MADSERSAATTVLLGPAGPTFQAVERHSTTIAASADQVWAAPAQVTVGELRLFRLLRVACTGARSTRRFARYWG